MFETLSVCQRPGNVMEALRRLNYSYVVFPQGFQKWDFGISGIRSTSSLFIDHLNIHFDVTEKVFQSHYAISPN